MTWYDLVRQVWPDVSDELADALLWTTSCFPMCDKEAVLESLRKYHTEADGNPQKAIDIVHAEIAAELKRLRYTNTQC